MVFTIDASKVRALMFERGVGINELARQAQINPLTARKLIEDDAKVTAKVIGAVAKFFNVDGNELLKG